jgi:hypothetical protein
MAESEADLADLDRALRHCRAGLRALEAARARLDQHGGVYPTHLYVAAVELTTATEIALAAGLRNQEPSTPPASQKR